MNSKRVLGGFILVIASVLINLTVASQVVTDRSTGALEGLIERFLGQDFLSTASKSDAFLYYFSQIGMILGLIIIFIGIFSVDIGKDFFNDVKKKILPSQEIVQEEEEIMHEEKDKEVAEHVVLPSMPPEIRELMNKCEKGEISTKDLENMFIEGKITWEQYNTLKGRCIK